MISGKVVKGANRGKKIGFHTANIPYKGELRGVYAVKVIFNKKEYKGVANIGYAPTFGRKKRQLEVHIFRFSKNIVGKKLDVHVVKKLRDEKKFASAEELTEQIKKDVKRAKKILTQMSD